MRAVVCLVEHTYESIDVAPVYFGRHPPFDLESSTDVVTPSVRRAVVVDHDHGEAVHAYPPSNLNRFHVRALVEFRITDEDEEPRRVESLGCNGAVGADRQGKSVAERPTPNLHAANECPIGVVAERAGRGCKIIKRGGVDEPGCREYRIERLRPVALRKVEPIACPIIRVAIIRAAQSVGLTLSEITESFATLPAARTPTEEDWTRLSQTWREALDERIERLNLLRDQLTRCIGCGCVSLTSCGLINSGDALGAEGAGARRLAQRSTAQS
ncbi:MAG: redox-sensitive transcriptional activator SoxR [Acidobacteria bacterium]|nr:redox-sensitive transcriptional activator SoxR [Acidobacteriota bacterium]